MHERKYRFSRKSGKIYLEDGEQLIEVGKSLNAEVLNVKKSLIKIAQNMLNFGRRIKIF